MTSLSKPTLADLPLLNPGHPSRTLDRKWHLGMYGVSGSGKTITIGSAGNIVALSPVLLVDCEEGDVTVDSWELPNVTVIRVMEYWRWANGPQGGNRKISLWEAFIEVLSAIEVASKLPDFLYRLVAVDGGTQIHDWCDDQIIIEQRAKPPSENEGRTHDPELANLPDYRRMGSRLAEVFWRIKWLPVHTILTAKERKLETPDSTKDHKMYEARADFIPSVITEFEGIFDLILHAGRRISGTSEEYEIHSKLSVRYNAKARVKGFPSPITCKEPEKNAEQIFKHLLREEVKIEVNGEEGSVSTT